MLLKVITIKMFCSRLVFIGWLQDHLIPCPLKYITGIDCPGCGFQRSVLALMQGNWNKSFMLYPAAIPLILFFAYGLADKYLKIDNPKNMVKKSLFVIVGTIILISYGLKMWHSYNYFNT